MGLLDIARLIAEAKSGTAPAEPFLPQNFTPQQMAFLPQPPIDTAVQQAVPPIPDVDARLAQTVNPMVTPQVPMPNIQDVIKAFQPIQSDNKKTATDTTEKTETQETEDGKKSFLKEFLKRMIVPGITTGVGMGVPGALPGAAGFAKGYTEEKYGDDDLDKLVKLVGIEEKQEKIRASKAKKPSNKKITTTDLKEFEKRAAWWRAPPQETKDALETVRKQYREQFGEEMGTSQPAQQQKNYVKMGTNEKGQRVGQLEDGTVEVIK